MVSFETARAKPGRPCLFCFPVAMHDQSGVDDGLDRYGRLPLQDVRCETDCVHARNCHTDAANETPTVFLLCLPPLHSTFRLGFA